MADPSNPGARAGLRARKRQRRRTANTRFAKTAVGVEARVHQFDLLPDQRRRACIGLSALPTALRRLASAARGWRDRNSSKRSTAGIIANEFSPRASAV